MKQTLYGYSVNPLYRYISTIFWQIDINGNVRTGKIMKYDGKTGHRIKELHSLIKQYPPLLHLIDCLGLVLVEES